MNDYEDYDKTHWNESEEYEHRLDDDGTATSPVEKFKGMWSEADAPGEEPEEDATV